MIALATVALVVVVAAVVLVRSGAADRPTEEHAGFRDTAPARRGVPLDSAERVDAADSLVLEEGGPRSLAPETDDEAWLPLPPNRDVSGMSGVEIAQYYWGDQWPAIREELVAKGALGVLESFVAVEGTTLGQAGDLLDGEFLTAKYSRYLGAIGGAAYLSRMSSVVDPHRPDRCIDGILAQARAELGPRSNGARLDTTAPE